MAGGLQYSYVVGSAFLLRIALIAYGEWQDIVMNLKYTDIDYGIFSSAAEHVHKGGSPYDTATYRYTPLLAYMMLPNIHIHPSFGKVLFCVFDMLVGHLIYKMLKMRGVGENMAVFCSATWLFNPLPVVVSSRGNAESVLACMVLGTIYLIMKGYNVPAAFLFALSVHTKTYPIIYAPSIYLLVNEKYGTASGNQHTRWKRLLLLLWPSDIAWVFAIIGVFVLGGLTSIFYDMYGQIFLDETYLYHITRKDTQHNFSIYFYPLRISEQLGPFVSKIIGLCAFIPQLGATLSFSFKYYRDLPFCWFMITLAFVTFNKVCTSQYFLWYLCLMPLIIPMLSISISDVIKMSLLWFTAQVIWFVPAYYHEYHHYDILIYVWMASLYFFWINIWCIWKLMKAHHSCAIFSGNEINSITPRWQLSEKSQGKKRS